MNTRINELLTQAGFDPAALQRMGVMPQAEKFVELLLLDVISLCRETQAEALRNRNGSPEFLKSIDSSIEACEDIVNKIAYGFNVHDQS